jgi:hypothetical protein
MVFRAIVALPIHRERGVALVNPVSEVWVIFCTGLGVAAILVKHSVSLRLTF